MGRGRAMFASILGAWVVGACGIEVVGQLAQLGDASPGGEGGTASTSGGTSSSSGAAGDGALDDGADDGATSDADDGATGDAPDDATADVDASDANDGGDASDANDGGDASDANDGGDGGACDASSGAFLNGGHCFFTLDAATADAAIQACAAKGAHLATMTSKAEQDFVTARLSKYAWIGLRATPGSNTKSDFSWITGEQVNFTAWDLDDPNESSGCVIIKFDYDAGRNWSDRPCSDLYLPLCETE